MEEADLIVETPKDTKNAAILHLPEWRETRLSEHRQRFEELLGNFKTYPTWCYYSCFWHLQSVVSFFSFPMNFSRNRGGGNGAENTQCVCSMCKINKPSILAGRQQAETWFYDLICFLHSCKHRAKKMQF